MGSFKVLLSISILPIQSETPFQPPQFSRSENGGGVKYLAAVVGELPPQAYSSHTGQAGECHNPIAERPQGYTFLHAGIHSWNGPGEQIAPSQHWLNRSFWASIHADQTQEISLQIFIFNQQLGRRSSHPTHQAGDGFG